METRERILGAALRIFAESGSRGATTRRIAQEAEINEVTLFRHFGSKEKLIREALVYAAEQTSAARLPGEPRDPIAELVAWTREGLVHLYSARSLIRTSMGEFEENPEVSSMGLARRSASRPSSTPTLQRLRERG